MKQKTVTGINTFFKLICISLISVIFAATTACSSGGGGGSGSNGSVVDTGGTDTGGSGTGGNDTGSTDTGGNDGGSGDVSPALGVITVDPANGDTNIERDAVVTVTFTDGMDEATINDANFTLGDSSGNSVSGVVNYDAMSQVATFTPATDMGVFRTYTATLSADITHSGGTSISAMNWSFVIRDGVWGPAEKIETDSVASSYPQIEFDPDGNAIAVWINNKDIYANKYTAFAKSWGIAERIDSLPQGVSDLQLAIDSSGNAIAVWVESQGSATNIRAARYNGTSWEADVGLETNGGQASDPQLAFDASGNAIVVWLQPGNSINSVWYNRYDASGAGWGTAELLETTDNVAFAPQVAVTDSGDAIAVWTQGNSAGYVAVYASYYTAGDSWGGASEIASEPSDGYTVQIAADGDGNAIAVWYQIATGPSYTVWANRYSGGLWGIAEVIENDVNVASIPQIVFDAHGNAMAVWKNSAGRLRYNVNLSSTGWGTADNVESGSDSAFFPQLAIDAEGNAIVVWRQVTNLYYNSMWVNRYQFGNGWGTPELLEMEDMYPVSYPEVAVDNNGNAFAIWIQSDGSADSAWVSRFE
jgi:hypothetical protein